MKSLNSIFSAFLLFATIHSFSQSGPSFLKPALWLMEENNTKLSPDEKHMPANFLNFNPVLDFSKKDVANSYKHLVKKQGSLFVVFRSLEHAENGLLVLSRPGSKVFVTNKKVQCDKETTFNKGNPKEGLILSYFDNINSSLNRKNGQLLIDDLFYNDKEGKNQIMELLYFQTFLNEREKNIVESYLAIKYGISLIGDKDYYDTQYGKLWDFKANKAFNSRVTGFGRDNGSGLDQKQSGNATKDGLYIGLGKITNSNSENINTLQNMTFLIWGDNNASCQMEDGGDLRKMGRVWKIESVSKEEPQALGTQIVVNKKEMPALYEKDAKTPMEKWTWLAIDSTANSGNFDYTKARFIKAATEDTESAVFANVIWKANTSGTFTFVKAADFFVMHETENPNCLLSQGGKITIKIVGGTAPYRIRLSSGAFTKELSVESDHAEIKDVPSGSYLLQVADSAKQVQNDNILIDSFENATVTLAPKWILNTLNQVVVAPEIANPAAIASYAWYFNGAMIASEKELVATSAGEYVMTVTSRSGCQKDFKFDVLDNDAQGNSEWVIFPNPAKVSEQFFVRFNLKTPALVSIAIADLNGKIIKSKSLDTAKQSEWRESLPTAGTYLVIITKNGAVETGKLIIK